MHEDMKGKSSLMTDVEHLVFLYSKTGDKDEALLAVHEHMTHFEAEAKRVKADIYKIHQASMAMRKLLDEHFPEGR